jgi:UrcA family protein
MDPPAALAAADSVRVWLADLDLSTPEGVSAARERVRLAARRVCAKIANSADIQRRLDYITCVDDAMAPSVAQIDGLSRKTFAQRFTHNLADQ